MNIKKCTSSHFYDSDKHSVCPHCFPEISCFSDGGNTEENIPDSAECVQQASDDKTCSFREKNTEKHRRLRIILTMISIRLFLQTKMTDTRKIK